jgi:hypothetical protein
VYVVKTLHIYVVFMLIYQYLLRNPIFDLYFAEQLMQIGCIFNFFNQIKLLLSLVDLTYLFLRSLLNEL